MSPALIFFRIILVPNQNAVLSRGQVPHENELPTICQTIVSALFCQLWRGRGGLVGEGGEGRARFALVEGRGDAWCLRVLEETVIYVVEHGCSASVVLQEVVALGLVQFLAVVAGLAWLLIYIR